MTTIIHTTNVRGGQSACVRRQEPGAPYWVALVPARLGEAGGGHTPNQRVKGEQVAKAAKEEKAEKEAPKKEVPSAITFMDDKRAQYARLVVFNYARDNKGTYGVKADHDVNSVPQSILLKAAKDLAGGNMLNGKEGLELIKTYSANGSTTGRALTDAYASEVRPFIRKLQLSEKFGRRGGLTDEERAEREEKQKKAAEEKKEAAEAKKKEREEKAAKEKAEKEAKAKAEAEKK